MMPARERALSAPGHNGGNGNRDQRPPLRGDRNQDRPSYLPTFFNEVTLGHVIMVASILLTLGVTYQKVLGSVDLLEARVDTKVSLAELKLQNNTERLTIVEREYQHLETRMSALEGSLQTAHGKLDQIVDNLEITRPGRN